jgi:hypothetical protein
LQGSSNPRKFIAQILLERLLVPTLKQLARSTPNSRKLLRAMTFHQILFLKWMRQGYIGKSYRQEPVSFISFYIYYKILQKKKKKKSKQLTLHSFLMSSKPRPGPSSGK